MKAAVWTKYGPPEVLQLQDVQRPVPKDDEVLVRVHASSINSWDWELMNGRAHITLGGRLKPPYKILGCDVAGTVDEVGKGVTLFMAEVIHGRTGCFPVLPWVSVINKPAEEV